MSWDDIFGDIVQHIDLRKRFHHILMFAVNQKGCKPPDSWRCEEDRCLCTWSTPSGHWYYITIRLGNAHAMLIAKDSPDVTELYTSTAKIAKWLKQQEAKG